MARVGGQVRWSWIVSPADGKLPYTAEGKKRVAKVKASVQSLDNPEARDTMERCLMPSFAAIGPPILNSPYAANYQIVQTPNQVIISAEVNHVVRIVRLNATHAPAAVRSWEGDSIGHWEKDTLVVETTNVLPGAASRMPSLYISPDARTKERFTRVSATELRHEFAIDDPAIYTQVWRGQEPFVATKGPIYEFACHEGNYGLAGILAGARHIEAEAR